MSTHNSLYTPLLLICDDIWMIELVKYILSRQGLKACSFNSWELAAEWLDENDYAIILIDYLIDGVTADAIIKDFPDKKLYKFVVFTSNEEVSLAVKIMQTGAIDFLVKNRNLVHTLPKSILNAQHQISTELQLEAANRELEELSVRMQLARESDRKQIAADIHDILGQNLTAMIIELKQLRTNLISNQLSTVNKVINVAEDSIDTIHRISAELSPRVLDYMGIIEAIEFQLKEFQKRTGIVSGLFYSNRDIDLHEGQSIALYRIVQEALTNVQRHSEASMIEVKISKTENQLELILVDNGIGIKNQDIDVKTSLGIFGMQERIRPWKGEVVVGPAEGKGTRVTVHFPLVKRPRQEGKLHD